MRSRSLPLGFLLLLGGSCAQIIGLGDYDKTDDEVGGTGGASNGGVGTGGGAGATSKGGTNSSRGGTSSGGDNTPGGTADAGAGTGGAGATTSAGAGGASAGAGGLPDVDAGAGGVVVTSGGVVGTGGTLPSAGRAGGGGVVGFGGTLNTAGKSGSGGATTGGAGGKGGTSGGTGGVGGKGGTTGGTGGTTCSTSDMLLNNNPNFDNSNASPPNPTPWVDFSTAGLAVVNRQAFLTNSGVTAHTAGNALVLGGVGNSYDFEPGLGEMNWLDLDLTIPVGVTQITLSCYYQTQTLETTATIPTARDAMVARFWDNTLDESAYDFQWWEPSNSSAGWHLFSNTVSGPVATALASRTLALEFFAMVDDVRSSYFFIDTCSLRVTVCN